MPDEDRSIFLIAYFHSHLSQWLQLAKFLQRTGRHRVVVVFQNDYDRLRQEDWERFRHINVEVIDRRGNQIYPAASPDQGPPANQTEPPDARKILVASIVKKIPGTKILYVLWHDCVDFLSYFATVRHQKGLARRLLRHRKPQLVVLPEENALIATAVYTTSAKRLAIPSLIIPYTIADASEFAESVYSNRAVWITGLWRRWLARRWPEWTYEYRARQLFLQAWHRILIIILFRLSPPAPWMINSGWADAISVESHRMMNYYKERALPQEKLFLIGSIADDVLSHAQHQMSPRKVGERFDVTHKPTILCALPPPWFPRPECDFASFRDMIDFWVQTLQQVKGWEIVLHAHPRISAADQQYIEKRCQLPIKRTDICELIPRCDLYVANISSTIRWAIACGKPVINFDTYKWRFHDYDSAGGVITIEKKDDFIRQIHHVTTNHEYYQQLAQKQKICAPEWGMLDGQCGRRLLQLIDRLTT